MTAEPSGITVDDLPAIYHEGYLRAIEEARSNVDPADDWEGFRDHLWQSLAPVLGIDPTDSADRGRQAASTG